MIVRIGMLGAGFVGQVAHLDNFRRVPDCEVKAVCDVRPRLLEAVARRYGIDRTYTDHRALLEDPEVDAVVCTQPPEDTFPLAREALEAGKHLLVQSPMAIRSRDARFLVELAEENGRVLGVGCMKRFDVGVDRARSELVRLYETGAFGNLLRVDACCYGGDWTAEVRPPVDFPDEPPPERTRPNYPSFLPAKRRKAYLEFLRVYAMDLNLLRYLLPEGELTVTHALIADRAGGIAHTTSLRLEHIPVCLRGAASRGHEWMEEVVFLFEGGRLTVKMPTPLRMQDSALVERYESDGHGGELRALYSPRLWAFMLQAAAFTGAVAGIRGFRSPGRDALEDLLLAEEVFRKAEFI